MDDIRSPDKAKPLRVLILGLNFSPETTGISPYTTALAQGLTERGILVNVLTALPHYPEWKTRTGYGGWTTFEVIGSVSVTRLKHYVPANPRGVNRLLSELSFGARLLFARWGRPDIVVMVSPALFSTSIAMMRARLNPHRPAVAVWVQDLYSLGVAETGMGGGAFAQVIAWIESKTLTAAQGVVVIHERFGAYLSRRLGVHSDRIEVVPNWTHLNAVTPTDVVATRQRHGWSLDETVVLHAGNMGVKQGLENVVSAARLADEQQLPVRFVLLGNGSQRDELQVLGAGIVRLQFIGSLDSEDFQDALAAADILLVNEKPGVSEMAVPSKLTSYFNAARPVLGATDPSGLTAGEISTANAGRVVIAGDPQGLLDAAIALRDNPRLALQLGENGFRYRTEVLGEAAAIDRFEALLSNLVESVKNRRR